MNTNLIKRYFKVGAMAVIIFTATQLLLAANWQGPTQNPPNADSPALLDVSSVDQVKSGSLRVGKLLSDTALFVPTSGVPALPVDVLMWVGGRVLANDACLSSGVGCLSSLSPKNRTLFSGYGSYNNLDITGATRCYPVGGGNCVKVMPGSNSNYMTFQNSVTIKNLKVQASSIPSAGYCRYIFMLQNVCDGVEIYSTGLSCQIDFNQTVASCSNLNTSIYVDRLACLTLQVQNGENGCTGNATWTFETEN